MEKLKIVGWAHFDDSYPTKIITQENLSEVIDLVSDEIQKNKYAFSGEQHQTSLTGVPVFSDGTCLRASMRWWGMLMAALHGDLNEQNYSYMDFYMGVAVEEKLPESTEIEVEPAESEYSTFGFTLKQDREMIAQSLSMGMPFFTTDKVLSEMYDYYEKQLEQEKQQENNE